MDFDLGSFSELLHQKPLDPELLRGIPPFDPFQFVDQNFILPQQQPSSLAHHPNQLSSMHFNILTHTPELSPPLTASDDASSYPGTVVVMTPPQIPDISVTPATPPSPPPPLTFTSNTPAAPGSSLSPPAPPSALTCNTKSAKSRRRAAQQQLPYAPNLLNLNLAPTRRQSRKNNNTKSQQKQPEKPNTPHQCDYPGCQKTFTRPYNLKSHRRTHNAERPYACDHCPKRFARQHDRNRHQKLHLGIKPYTCPFCNKAFARQDALNRHQRPEKPHHQPCASVAPRSSFFQQKRTDKLNRA